MRKGHNLVPRLGIKQQLVLGYDLWATTERLQAILPCTICWKWVKGHQTQGTGSTWKVEVALNDFCDKKSEEARSLPPAGHCDPFFPDQQIGMTINGERIHGSPREAILEASHNMNLQQYICDKSGWSIATFSSVDWHGLGAYMKSIPNTKQTNVIKMVHNWIHDGYQKDLFATEGEAHICPAECGRREAHQHYISCYAPPMTTVNVKCMQGVQQL